LWRAGHAIDLEPTRFCGDILPSVIGGQTKFVSVPFVDRLHRRGNAYKTRCPHLGYADALRRGSSALAAACH
jgi:hypothetical protein